LNPFLIVERFREAGSMPSHRIGDFRSAGVRLAPDRHANSARSLVSVASLRSGNVSAEMTSQYFEAHFPSTIFIGENRIPGSIPSPKLWGIRQIA
jgi:hypothetical protein